MGDMFMTIVDADVSVENARETADLVVARLVARKLILPNTTDCGMGSPGHPPGPRAPEEAHFNPGANGMAIEIGRSVYGFGRGELETSCPGCYAGVPDTKINAMLADWRDGTFDGVYYCPECRRPTYVNDLPWEDAQPLFGSLAFVFWNWPEIELCDDLERRTGHTMLQSVGKL